MPELPSPPAPEQRDLGRKLLRAAGWMLGSQFSTQIFGFVTTAIVARLLGPREMGLAGMALVFSSLAIVIVEGGVGAAIIQRHELSDEAGSTAFVLSILFGLGMLALGVALSWPIAALFGEPKVQRLCAVISLAYLFTALGIVPEAILMRELRFGEAQRRYILASLVSCAAAIAVALAGGGAWAIVVQALVISGLSTALRWPIVAFRPSRGFSRHSAREIGAFGGRVLGSNLTDWATQNVDNLLVGRYLHASALGAYALAYNVAVAPVKRIALPLANVFFPAFSRMEERRQIVSTWFRAVRAIALVTVPALVGLCVLAPDFVALVYGPKWHSAVPVLRLLALVGLQQTLARLGSVVLQATGDVKLLFRLSLASSTLTVAAFAIGLIWGLTGVAVAYLAITTVVQPAFTAFSCRAAQTSFRAWLGSISGVLQAGFGVAAITVAGRAALASAPGGVRLGACVVAAVLGYLALVVWRAPEVKQDLAALRHRAAAETEPVPA